VAGVFRHTVVDVDRLDHLAYKYYKQPRKWWRICDASPEFMSPQALLGKEPIVTQRFLLAVEDDGTAPPWAKLLRNLSQEIGIEDVKVEEDIRLVPEEQIHDGQRVTICEEHYERAVMVTYNQNNVSAKDLTKVIADSGFEAGQAVNISRIGKDIVIPRDVVG
jgi:hypothetical protein